jgi:hypothetical protein
MFFTLQMSFQILNLSLFEVFKKLKNRTEDIESQVDIAVHVVKVICATEETCISFSGSRLHSESVDLE